MSLGLDPSILRAPALALAVALVSVQAANATAPAQATVFDGSGNATDIRYATYPTGVFEVDQGPGGFVCPGTTYVPTSGTFNVGSAGTSVFTSSTGFGSSMTAFLTEQPRLAAPSIDGIENDCDLEAGYAGASAYAVQAANDAANLAADVDACVAQVEIVYCQIVAAIEAATLLPPASSFHLEAGDFPSHEVGAFSQKRSCGVFAVPLAYDVPHLLDGIARRRGTCLDILAHMQTTLAGIGAMIPSNLVAPRLAGASSDLHSGHQVQSGAQQGLARIEQIRDDMTSIAVQAACADCSAAAIPPYSPRSASTTLTRETTVLSDLAAVFQLAAQDATEPEEIMRLNDIAAHMLGVPENRVLQLTHATSRAVRSHAVALRSDLLPDDGVTPLAVIVTSEPSGPGTAATPTDEGIYSDAWRTTAQVLDLAGASPPDDDDDDDDGVRDVFETGTGDYVSPSDTGTSSSLADTDGDLYRDGVERRGGSDPNDPASIPPALASALPLLPGAAGGVLLAVMLCVAALRLAGSDRGSVRTPRTKSRS